MLTTAKVIDMEGNIAIVEVRRKSACEGCHKMTSGEGCGVCSLLGSDSSFTSRALNRIGAKIGDRVEVQSATGRVLLYSALVFLGPVIVGLLLYALSGFWFESETPRILMLLGGFCACFVALWIYSKFFVAKRYDAEIVRILPAEVSQDQAEKEN